MSLQNSSKPWTAECGGTYLKSKNRDAPKGRREFKVIFSHTRSSCQLLMRLCHKQINKQTISKRGAVGWSRNWRQALENKNNLIGRNGKQPLRWRDHQSQPQRTGKSRVSLEDEEHSNWQQLEYTRGSCEDRKISRSLLWIQRWGSLWSSHSCWAYVNFFP